LILPADLSGDFLLLILGTSFYCFFEHFHVVGTNILCHPRNIFPASLGTIMLILPLDFIKAFIRLSPRVYQVISTYFLAISPCSKSHTTRISRLFAEVSDHSKKYWTMSIQAVGISQGQLLQCALPLTSIIVYCLLVTFNSKRVILTDVRYWFLCGASSLVSATFEGSEGGSFSSVDCQLFYFLLSSNTIGSLHYLPALVFEGDVSIIPNTVTVTHLVSFR